MATKTPVKAIYTGSDTTALGEFESGDTLATSLLDTGTSANQLVKLDSNAKLPAVDGSQLTGIDGLPSQSGNSGKYLTTDGSAASWGTVASGGGGASDIDGLSDASYDSTTNSLGVGASALSSNSGTSNTALGYEAGMGSSATANWSTFIGAFSGKNITYGHGNTGVGISTLKECTSGRYNTAVGKSALSYNTTGQYNTALGMNSLFRATTGSRNTAVGYNALEESTTAEDNTAVGESALNKLTTGTRNVAIGRNAAFSTTTGNDSVIIGEHAGYYNTTGNNNVAVGQQACFRNTTGRYNIAIGTSALQDNETGENNLAMGWWAAKNVDGATSNMTALGFMSMYNNTSGTKNIGIGPKSGYENTTGANNIVLGYEAGKTITTGSNNTVIGQLNGTATMADTVLIGAGTTERLKIDSTGLYVNGSSTALGGGGGAWTEISSTTVSSAVAQIEYTLSGYSVYKILYWGCNWGSNDNSFAVDMTVGSGSYSETLKFHMHRFGGTNTANHDSLYAGTGSILEMWPGTRVDSSNGSNFGEITIFNTAGMPTLQVRDNLMDDTGSLSVGITHAIAGFSSPSSTDTIGKIKLKGSQSDNFEGVPSSCMD
mgnify:FL=1